MTMLIAIMSCERDRVRGCHTAIRRTWLNDIPHAAYKFVLGRDAHACEVDEMVVAAGDGYDDYYQKANATVALGLDLGADHLFMCDVDTYVVLHRLHAMVALHPDDYVGYRGDEGHACGGHGILFSRLALAVLGAYPAGANHFDLHAGRTLAEHCFTLRHSPGFLGSAPADWRVAGITAHLGTSTGTWEPDHMLECHEQFLKDTGEDRI